MPTRAMHIFRAGTHTSMSGNQVTFTDQHLRATAEVYNARQASARAPLFMGHPTPGEQAIRGGEVLGLVERTGNLYAVAEVEPAFIEHVRNGHILSVSAAFCPPHHPGNPAPGIYSLNHVAFLGAVSPAVKGLERLAFSDIADAYTLAQRTEAAMRWVGYQPETIEFSDPGQDSSAGGWIGAFDALQSVPGLTQLECMSLASRFAQT